MHPDSREILCAPCALASSPGTCPTVDLGQPLERQPLEELRHHECVAAVPRSVVSRRRGARFQSRGGAGSAGVEPLPYPADVHFMHFPRLACAVSAACTQSEKAQRFSISPPNPKISRPSIRN